MKRNKFTVLGLLVMLTLIVTAVQAAGPTGAIFTTTPDGTIVNENVRYNTKLEVYLDGGPGPNAPQTAAGLDDDLYVFQVTDPPGKYLLSQDPAKCRVVEVVNGVIYRLVLPSELGFSDDYIYKGKLYPCHILDGDPADGVKGPSGRHDWNYDADYGPEAKVVQLMPFGTTPNNGGVYKAWMTPLAKYKDKGGELDAVPAPLNGTAKKECPDFCAAPDPGFTHPDIKTDNFKVKGKIEPPLIYVKKFHDRDFDGVWDPGEEEVTGWEISIADPGGPLTGPFFTPVVYLAGVYPGDYTVVESMPAGTLQTVSYLDGGLVSLIPAADPLVTVPVVGMSGETHTVIYGDVGLGEIEACKVFDRNANGMQDEGEPYIPGWKFELTGTLANGVLFGPVIQTTGEGGCTTFAGLLPGDYTVTELMPSGSWVATGDLSQSFSVVSTLDGAVMTGSKFEALFTNFCFKLADFDTKGYWHNKNGLTELYNDPDFDALLAWINGLDPYDDPTGYFDNGEEPFDGLDEFGMPVPPAMDSADFGATLNEISQFLVDPNAGGDPREQLAQQLLAFIFNVNYRVGSPMSAIYVNGMWLSGQEIIDAALAAWTSPGTDDDHYWEPILDGLNNNDAVMVVCYLPCPVVYLP